MVLKLIILLRKNFCHKERYACVRSCRPKAEASLLSGGLQWVERPEVYVGSQDDIQGL